MNTLKTLDPAFRYQVAARPGGEGLLVCFSCGVCTASCPVAEVEESFNPRRMIHRVLLGDREILKEESLWVCVGCFRCTAHCPQGVEFTNVLRVLRDMSIEEGFVPKEWKAIVEDLDRRTQRFRRRLIRTLWEKKVFSFPEYEESIGHVLSGEEQEDGA